MNSDKIISFKNDTIGEIRGFIDEKTGEPWFFAGKVCDCLKIKNSSDALNNLVEKHNRFGDKIKGVAIIYPLVKTKGGFQKVAAINESLLYELIFQSRTEKAFVFQQWVFKEVLPSLRKYGEYRMTGKLIRRSLTDSIQDSGENERMHGHGISNYTRLINKSLGLPNTVDRSSLSDEMLERVARREDTVRCLINEGKCYTEIKNFIEASSLQGAGK